MECGFVENKLFCNVFGRPENGLIEKSGSWFSYNGSKLGQGRESVRNLLKDNPELMEELELKIKELI